MFHEAGQLPEWGRSALELIGALMTGASCDGDACRRSLPHLEALGLDSLYYMAFEPDHPRQHIYDTLWACQRDAYAELRAEAEAEGLRLLIFKGGASFGRWYGDHALGAMTDVDLLVRREDIPRIIPILYRQGFAPGIFEDGNYWMRDIQDIGVHESQHYELVPYNRVGVLPIRPDALPYAAGLDRPALHVTPESIAYRVEFDVHHGVASDIEAEGFFDRAIEREVGWTFSDADHLWFGLSRLYTEIALYGKAGLRDLAYAAPILARGEVDWPVVVTQAAANELRPSIYYFLALLDALAGGVVPPEVLDELHPTRGLRHRDWGWQIGKLLGGIDPAPRLPQPSRATVASA